MTAVLQPRSIALPLDGTMGRLACESLLFEVEVSIRPSPLERLPARAVRVRDLEILCTLRDVASVLDTAVQRDPGSISVLANRIYC